MRYPASEKAEIIQLVEQSHLPAKRTLDKLGIPRATFYRWYDRYREGGPEALDDRRSDQIVSGTGSRIMSAARSSTWRWIFQNCRRESWRYGSPTRGNILSRRHRQAAARLVTAQNEKRPPLMLRRRRPSVQVDGRRSDLSWGWG